MKIVKEARTTSRGLVGGPYANTKCMSGVALAGAKDPTNGAPLCIPVVWERISQSAVRQL